MTRTKQPPAAPIRPNSKEDRAARAIMQAVGDHWDDAGHDGDEMFRVTKENPIVCTCYVCGVVLWQEKPARVTLRSQGLSLTAVYIESPEGGHVAYIEEIPGAHTQGETIEETRQNLREALDMMLSANREHNREAFGAYRVALREPFSPRTPANLSRNRRQH